jgi:rare lipoprotein A (peptidoglycan hydrolase)
MASYFGGGSGACGGGSWGVANKTLPCHTRLTICAAHCVQVSVTDRGPYIAGREFDLTTDVANAVGAAPWEGGFSVSAGQGTVRVTVR